MVFMSHFVFRMDQQQFMPIIVLMCNPLFIGSEVMYATNKSYDMQYNLMMDLKFRTDCNDDVTLVTATEMEKTSWWMPYSHSYIP